MRKHCLQSGFSPFAWLLAFAALSLLFSAAWVASRFSMLNVETVLYMLHVPLQGVDKGVIASLARAALLWPVVVLAGWGTLLCCLERAAHTANVRGGFFSLLQGAVLWLRVYATRLCLGLCVLALGWFGYQIQLQAFLNGLLAPDPPSLVDAEYRPLPEKLFFGQKRNLIWVFMESHEATFANDKIFGANLMPGLTALPGLRFANHVQAPGTSWTVAGLTGYLLGLPFFPKIPMIHTNNRGLQHSFLPGAKGLAEALNGAGYDVRFLQAADLKFEGKDYFLEDRHFLPGHVTGAGELYARFPELEEKAGSWGVHDDVLLGIAKGEISRLAEAQQPFAFLLLSVDGHPPVTEMPEGYPRPNGNFRDVLLYCDNQFTAFARWAMAQPWYENTLLVFASDHLNAGADDYYTGWLKPHQEKRRNFNLIMNSALAVPDLGRTISHFDMLPTVLEALGANLPERRLGLGVSLFSGKPTLAEIYGKNFDMQVNAYSPLYKSLFNTAEK